MAAWSSPGQASGAPGIAPARPAKATRRSSGTRWTPVAASTRRWTSRTRPTTSAARPCPSGSAWKKLAWRSETQAVPTRKPFRPQASMSRPAESPGGLVNTDPALLPPGWLARRHRTTSSISALHASAGSGGHGELGPQHDVRRAEVRARGTSRSSDSTGRSSATSRPAPRSSDPGPAGAPRPSPCRARRRSCARHRRPTRGSRRRTRRRPSPPPPLWRASTGSRTPPPARPDQRRSDRRSRARSASGPSSRTPPRRSPRRPRAGSTPGPTHEKRDPGHQGPGHGLEVRLPVARTSTAAGPPSP